MARTDALITLRRVAEERRLFRGGEPAYFATANACLDVLGALESEAGGTLAQMVLPAQVAVGVQRSAENCLRIRSGQIVPPVGSSEVMLPLEPVAGKSEAEVRTHLASLAASPAAWALPLLALWWQVDDTRAGTEADVGGAGGATILIHGDIPMGAGQASSTALLAATALAIEQLNQRAAPAPLATAQWAASAEAMAAPDRGGQIEPARLHVINGLTSLYRHENPSAAGKRQILRYSAQPYRLVGPVPLPANVCMFALDTGVRYTRVRETLEELHVAAQMGRRIIETIYRDLGQPHIPLHDYLANTSPLLYRQYFRALLPRRLRGSDFIRTYGPQPGIAIDAGEDPQTARLYRVRTAVDHLIAEHEHAEQFLQAMEELADAHEGTTPMDEAERQRTLHRAGRLLLASHHSYRLRLELSCREADWLVDRLMEAGPDRGIYGARITGAGGGGTVAALLERSGSATDALLEVMKAYHQVTGLTLGVSEA